MERGHGLLRLPEERRDVQRRKVPGKFHAAQRQGAIAARNPVYESFMIVDSSSRHLDLLGQVDFLTSVI